MASPGQAAGAAAAAAPPAAFGPAAPALPPLRSINRVEAATTGNRSLMQDIATQATITTGQLLVVVTQWAAARGSLLMRVQPVIVLALIALPLPIMLLRRDFYLRHRSWLLPLLRVAPMLPPSTRSVGVGTATLLERAAQPGLKGTVVAALRTATGVRLLPEMAQSVFQAPLPPLAALLTHAAITALTFNSQGYCATLLLSSGPSRALQARLAAGLDLAVMLLAGTLMPTDVINGRAGEQAVCAAVMTFVHVTLGFLIPTLLAVYSYQPQQQQQRRQQQREHGDGSPAGGMAAGTAGGCPRRTWAAALHQLAGRADRGIHAMLCGHHRASLRALLCFNVVCAAWIVSTTWAGL